MRIVQIGSYPQDVECIKGGIEASVYGLSKELSKHHFVFVIDTPRKVIDGDSLQKEHNLEILRLKNRGKTNIGVLFRVLYALKKIKMSGPDICQIHGTNFFQLFIYIGLRMHKIPVILTVHGLLNIEQRNLWRKKKTAHNLVKYFLKSYSEFLLLGLNKRVIVDTRYVADQISAYRRNHKIWRQPLCVIIPQGIDDSFFKIPDHYTDNKLLSVGSINRRKGHIKLLEVVYLLDLIHNHDVTLDIAGVLNDPVYYNELKEKIDELGLRERVKIHANLLNEEIKKLYEFSYIFILHSEEESQGIVLAQAMACGKPVVATSAGGIPDVIQHGVNGLLCDYSDVEAFSCNIQKLLADKKLREQISERNRLQSHRYSWEIITKSILETYNIVLSEETLIDQVKPDDKIL